MSKKKKDNVVSFKDSFRKEYIKLRSRKYNLPVDLVSDLVFLQELHGFDVTTVSGRIYMDDCLSINAVRYHNS